MHLQVHYQNLDHTPWMDSFVQDRVNKLDKYLTPASSVHVNFRYENRSYVTSLAIHNPHHDYAFISEGLNLFESLASAVDRANRAMGEHKKKIKDKIHSKMASLRARAAE